MSFPNLAERGPQAYTHAERMQRAQQIAAAMQLRWGPRVLAVSLYGSLARDADGPYSDIEMFVLLAGQTIDRTLEWSAGSWKAEVDLCSPDSFLAAAAELDEFWPLTQGGYVHYRPLHDPQSWLPRARQAVFAHSEADFRNLIAEVIVGDLYEALGKVRNGLRQGRKEMIAPFSIDAARYGACLVGLHNRQVYQSGSSLFSESLQLPGRPAGYDALARLVMTGELANASRVARALDEFWAGVEDWAAAQNLPLTHQLVDLLAAADD